MGWEADVYIIDTLILNTFNLTETKRKLRKSFRSLVVKQFGVHVAEDNF